MTNETNFDCFSFADLTGRSASRPANYDYDMGDGDFDDYFTAEDIDRRRYERECRRYR
jgi:hypothetical protein